MIRSVEEIRIRCLSIINNKRIVSFVMASSSPTAAYEMVFTETQDVSKAKAGRWLAVLRRDHLTEYKKLILTTLSHANNGKAQQDKEESHEDNLCK